MTVLRLHSARLHTVPVDPPVDPPPEGYDATFTIRSNESLFIHDDAAVQSALDSWLDTIDDTNRISVDIGGQVKLKYWGWYIEEGEGTTRTCVRRNLRSFLRARTIGVPAGSTAYWKFTSWTGPNQSGVQTSFVIGFNISNEPRLTVDISSRGYSGMGGYKLSWFNDSVPATDWVISAQSDPNNPFAIWYNPTTFLPWSVAWADASGGNTTYLGTRKQTVPAKGDAAYWVDVTSATLGVTRRIVFNVKDTIIDVVDFPGRDKSSSPYNQLAKLWSNGAAPDGTHSAVLYWGDEILVDGIVNDIAASNTSVIKQPVQRSGGPPAPLTPHGTNADIDDPDIAWNPIYPHNPGYIVHRSRFYLNGGLRRATIRVDNLTDTRLGFRFSGMDLNKKNSASNYSLYFSDNAGTGRGIHSITMDHCLDYTWGPSEGDYNSNFASEYCEFDNNNFDWYADNNSTPLGFCAADSIVWGNVYRNFIGDITKHWIFNSVVGNGRSRFGACVVVDKILTPGAHSDVYQPGVAASGVPIHESLDSDSPFDIGYFDLGIYAVKGRGTLIPPEWVGLTKFGFLVTEADVGAACADTQGIFANPPVLRPTLVSKWRSDLRYLYKGGCSIHIGASGYGRVYPPRHADGWIVNVLTTFPYNVTTGDEYYTNGWYHPGDATIAPTWFSFQPHDVSVTTSVDGFHCVRNVMVNNPGAVPSGMIGDNLGDAYFGNPTEHTATPAKLLEDFVDPLGAMMAEDIRDFMAGWALTPTSGMRKEVRGTTYDFGPVVVELFDPERHTFDAAKMFSY